MTEPYNQNTFAIYENNQYLLTSLAVQSITIAHVSGDFFNFMYLICYTLKNFFCYLFCP